MSMDAIYLDGISLLGPGLPDWEEAVAILCGDKPAELAPVTVTAPALLPATERRRAGTSIKLSMAVGLAAAEAAGIDPGGLANVFTSSGGDCENCHHLLDALASSERMISPTRFHNSVHNAAAGYWSIATHCEAASTSLSAYDASFGAGLIEAAGQVLTSGAPCLLIAFDTAYPEPLFALRPVPFPFGVGLVLSPTRGAHSMATLGLSLTRDPADTLSEPPLEQLRREIPTARALPLLQRLAGGGAGRVVLDYLDDTRLAIEVGG
ncbi:MAG: beta-ketoacyl synthase chain length factor [Paludibacterium sp.]|uniref:beta-ketoacyl synthase chain length factor n=1 Tax=Paludibacterium sp. TaxID=1917523 RepID=UPI0025EC125F|nr:beta-ketoacyl synthase chain length factor [Paludibacterium sp.]MBV8047875.1 beta-ketoacyl synthase chain length factor [Paludibacterium sp.]MBV8649746.1 beta-ketoacyl synthase chain length factor [Paludibacterium sp.]